MSRVVGTILHQCEVCKDQVVISYDCPNCKHKVCLICAINNNWKCPNCDQNLNPS